MNSPTYSPLSSDSQVSAAWLQALQAHLSDHEKIHVWLETNLDEQLNYSRQLLLLTDQRLIGLTWPALDFFEYPLGAGLTLRQQDHAGVGCIELFAAGTRLNLWRYTMAYGCRCHALRPPV